MTNAIRRGLRRDEGFTLIELMVVVMIIAVLIAIAIPSFLGFRSSAQDRSAGRLQPEHIAGPDPPKGGRPPGRQAAFQCLDAR